MEHILLSYSEMEILFCRPLFIFLFLIIFMYSCLYIFFPFVFFLSLQYGEQDQKMVYLPSNPRFYLPPEKPILATRSAVYPAKSFPQNKQCRHTRSDSQNKTSTGISDKYWAENCILSYTKQTRLFLKLFCQSARFCHYTESVLYCHVSW
jgi:hypothetical protein